MDALTLLAADHRRICTLLERVRQSPDPVAKLAVYQELRLELKRHSDLEEDHFYPQLAEHAELQPALPRFLEDHQGLRDLLGEIDELGGHEDVLELLAQLDDEVRLHLEIEEDELFPVIRDLLDSTRLEEMASRFPKPAATDHEAA